MNCTNTHWLPYYLLPNIDYVSLLTDKSTTGSVVLAIGIQDCHQQACFSFDRLKFRFCYFQRHQSAFSCQSLWKGWLGVRRINIPFSDVTCLVGLDVTKQTWTSQTTAARRTSTFAYNHQAQIVRCLNLGIYRRKKQFEEDPFTLGSFANLKSNFLATVLVL